MIIMEFASNFDDFAEPSPSDQMALIQLHYLFSDPDQDIDRIVEFISNDPQLTAETLKRCNMALFGRVEPVTDLFEAVCHLGYYELYGIVAALVGSRPASWPMPASPELRASKTPEEKSSGSAVAKRPRRSFSNGGLYS